MVDLRSQYERIKPQVDHAIQAVLDDTQFIQGPAVKAFQADLERYLDVAHVIPCANGTDALQIALMAIRELAGRPERTEVILPAFTYVATAEVVALLGLQPVMVDVDPQTFNLVPELVAQAVSPRTLAIVPVHLFGQSADMAPIMALAERHGIFVVEDNAQAIGADYLFPDGRRQKTGTIAHIGCTSFFPSKNLGCYGDGGAMMTADDGLAAHIRMVANHGQQKKYYHDVTGVNSRLDSLQAAVLGVKLPLLDQYSAARQAAAARYDAAFEHVAGLRIPSRAPHSSHVFHQYTLLVADGRRAALQAFLLSRGVPSMIYYPVPLYRQQAFARFVPDGFSLPVTERLCQSVLSLPIHTELTPANQAPIIEAVLDFFNA
jgi:UDP-2-acetamido-2-deoxy-ribo-hexuluronate aminotransferase